MLYDETGELDDMRYAVVNHAVQARETADSTSRMLMVHPNGADLPCQSAV